MSCFFLAFSAVAESPITYKFKKLAPKEIIARLESDLTAKRRGPDFVKYFHLIGNSSIEDAEFVLIPEHHYDVFSLLVQIQVVSELSKPGDVVLAELVKERDSELVVDCQTFSLGRLNHAQGPGTHQYQEALLKSSKLVAFWLANEIWPHSESMKCAGWDSLKLLKRQEALMDGLKKAGDDAERKAFASGDNDWIRTARKNILKEYGLKLSDLGLDNPLDDKVRLRQVLGIASAYARNLHMIKILKEKTPAPGSKIFVFAGSTHFPQVCGMIEIPASPEAVERYCRGFEIPLRALNDFLKGRKYVVLAHKELFLAPPIQRDEL